MKKLLLVGNLACLFAIFFQSCKQITEADKKAIIDEYKRSETGTIKSNSSHDFYCNPCTADAPNGNAGYRLNTNLLTEMSNQYFTSLPAPSDDSRAIWFSLDSLKNFIAQIERCKCGQNCLDTMHLGIRIYYGRYPDPATSGFSQISSLAADYKSKHTVFMIPTVDDGGYHWDFDPAAVDASHPCGIPKLDGTTPVSVYGMTIVPDNNAMNHGDLIPPPYPSYQKMGAYFLK